MDTVKVTVKSDEKASRLELFIRFVWGFIALIILGIVGIFACIAMCIQWLYILVTGKRHAGIQKFVNSWFTAYVQVYFYLYLATDERPPLIPAF